MSERFSPESLSKELTGIRTDDIIPSRETARVRELFYKEYGRDLSDPQREYVEGLLSKLATTRKELHQNEQESTIRLVPVSIISGLFVSSVSGNPLGLFLPYVTLRVANALLHALLHYDTGARVYNLLRRPYWDSQSPKDNSSIDQK